MTGNSCKKISYISPLLFAVRFLRFQLPGFSYGSEADGPPSNVSSGGL